jgi:hypothetical protein
MGGPHWFLMDREESERLYYSLGSDPLHWLEKAQGLKYGAEVLKHKLVVSMEVAPADRRIETLGLVMSSMLLLGLAMENLIKGVYVAKNPNLVARERIDLSLWAEDSGHGIASFAKTLTPLEHDEEELLRRLQEHVVWAGRYPIPTKSTRFHNSLHPDNLRRLNTEDFRVADRLFVKLAELLHAARQRSAQS